MMYSPGNFDAANLPLFLKRVGVLPVWKNRSCSRGIHTTYLFQTIGVLCCSVLFFMSHHGYAQSLNARQPGDYYLSPQPTVLSSEWTENVPARTLYSTTWQTDDGRVRVECSSIPLFFEDKNHELKRISHEPHWADTKWLADQQPHPVSVSNQGILTVHEGSPNAVVFGNKLRLNNQSSRVVFDEPYANGKLISAELAPGLRKEFIFGNNAIKYNYTMDFFPAINEGLWSATEEIHVPKGATIVRDVNHGKEVNDRWAGDLKILTHDGKIAATLLGALCRDSNGTLYLASYEWEPTALPDIWKLTLRVEESWLSNAVFPVVIDPLITGPLAEWSGDLINSCFIPEYHADSILVSLPGQITVTALLVTASFYADPFTAAVKDDGSMYFSTSCSETELFETNPPEGESPGLAYMENFDLRNQLMCCFVPSCFDTSFYLTMHLGRYVPEGDCNTSFIYYTPDTQWLFMAYIEGHTVESSGLQ